MLTFLPGEHIITSSDGNKVILTSHRICYKDKQWGRSYSQSIMLEHVTSCEAHYVAQYGLLIIAAVFLTGGLLGGINGSPEALSIGFLLALMLCILYLATRQNLIIIGSPSTKMRINVNGMKREAALAFIDQVESAKCMRR